MSKDVPSQYYMDSNCHIIKQYDNQCSYDTKYKNKRGNKTMKREKIDNIIREFVVKGKDCRDLKTSNDSLFLQGRGYRQLLYNYRY